MKYFPLIWAALTRRKVRTVLMLLSVLVAFLLFGLLDVVRYTFANAGQTSHGQDRLLVISRMGFGRPLPFSLLNQLKEVPGVVGIDYASYVFGSYQNPKNMIPVELHPDSFYDLYPELEVSPDARDKLRRTRAGVLAGEALAKKYNLKVGDRVPLETRMPRMDGSTTWTFEIVGLARWIDPNMKPYEEQLFGNWAYVEEARQSDKGTVAYYSVKVADVSAIDGAIRTIDAMTANSSHETKTQTENSWAAAMFRQFADMGLIATSIMGAVFFTLLLLTGHTMMQAVHERIPEFAVLKTIGFTGRSILALVLCESAALVLFGGIVGLAAATAAVAGLHSFGAKVMPIPILPLDAAVWIRGLTLAAAIGLIVGALPALRGMRLRIVDALSGR